MLLLYERIQESTKDQAGHYAVREAESYMKQHISDPLSLEEVAEHVGLNPNYFSTLFSKETGSKFISYLTALRMETAKKSLRVSNDKIEQIAGSVGYQDAKYFGKLFKQNTGITPKEYRRIYR